MSRSSWLTSTERFRVADGKSPISRCRGGSTALTSIRDAIPLPSLNSKPIPGRTSGLISATRHLTNGATTLAAEWSSNLIQWSAEGITTEILDDTGDVRTLKHSLPTNQEPRVFLRLRASR